MSYRYDCTEESARNRGLTRAATAVNEDRLIVVPTESVYGLACDAFSHSAINALHALKGSGRRQPPPVLIPHGRTLDGLATDVSPAARALAEALWPGALTLVCRAQPTLNWDLGDAHGMVSVRMPLHPVALELLEKTGPLALTSANSIGQGPPTTCDDARSQLGEAVEIYLDAGPVGYSGVSTVVDARGEVPRVVRIGALSLETLREIVPDILAPARPGEEAQA